MILISILSNITLTKWVIICIGALAGITFLFVIFLIWKVYSVENKYEKYVIRTSSGNNSNKPIDSFGLGNALRNSNSAKRFIKEVVEEEVGRIMHNPGKGLIEQISDAVYDDIRPMIKGDMKEFVSDQRDSVSNKPQASATKPQVETPTSAPNARNFYASALEEDNRTFYTVSEYPVPDETIFKFTEIKNGKCEFGVYEDAYSRVLADNSFLTGACRVTKIGNSRVIVTEKGIAELTTESKWVVLEPAKVKLE